MFKIQIEQGHPSYYAPAQWERMMGILPSLPRKNWQKAIYTFNSVKGTQWCIHPTAVGGWMASTDREWTPLCVRVKADTLCELGEAIEALGF